MWIAFVLLGVFLQSDPTAGVLIERRLAEDLPASVGDTILVRPLAPSTAGRAFVVEGIFERAPDPSRISRNDYEVRFHLPDLEAMQTKRDRIDRFAVALVPGADADRVSAWIRGLAFGTQVFPTARIADESSTTFRVVGRFHRAIAAVTLLASGIFLVCLMVIRIDERRADVRTMRLLGISRWSVLQSVLLESIAIAVIASLIGALLGALLTRGVNWYYAGVYDTTLRFAIVTPRILLLSAALGVAIGIGAGLLAATRLVGLSPQRLGER